MQASVSHDSTTLAARPRPRPSLDHRNATGNTSSDDYKPHEGIPAGTHHFTKTRISGFVKVLEGERPPRGVRFREGLWRMLEQCWGSQPNDRPTIEDVLRCLEMFSNSSEPSSLEVDEGMEGDGDDWDSTNGSSGVSNGTSGASSPMSSDLSE
jgi:hypothetical protein